MIRLLIISIAVLTTGLPAREDGRPIQFRVVCFEMAPGERNVVASGDPRGADRVELTLSRRLDSTLHKLNVTDGQVRIGNPAIAADGRSFIDPAAVAKLPKSGSQFLFLLVPNGNPSGRAYHCLPLIDDRKTFPPGGYRFVNFSPSKLRFLLQKQPIEISPGDLRVVGKVEGVRADGRFPYIAQYFDDDAWNRLSTGYWYTHPKIRSLQVAFLNPRTKRLSLKGYDDKIFMRSSAAKAQE